MALSASEKLKIKVILGIQVSNGGANIYSEDTTEDLALDTIMEALSAEQVTLLQGAITQYEQVQFSTGKLSGDFKQDPADTRARIRSYVIGVLGYRPKRLGAGFSIGRG